MARFPELHEPIAFLLFVCLVCWLFASYNDSVSAQEADCRAKPATQWDNVNKVCQLPHRRKHG
jgi:hypothetical protein